MVANVHFFLLIESSGKNVCDVNFVQCCPGLLKFVFHSWKHILLESQFLSRSVRKRACVGESDGPDQECGNSKVIKDMAPCF